MAQFFLIIAFLFLFSLLQTTFLVHTAFFGYVPNLVVALILIVAFLEDTKEQRSFWYAIAGGLFLDMFSATFFGLWTVLLLLSVFLVKFVVKSYVRPPILQR